LQEAVFERFRQASAFVTREHGGTGLALAREMAGLMGGTIRVESAEGEGACLEFRTPLVAASVSAPGEKRKPARQRREEAMPV
jgi:signal transduction histidine kinase